MIMSERFTLMDIFNHHGIVAIDTCALLNEGFEPMLRESAKFISEKHKSITIHSSVVNEIVRFSRNSKHSQFENAKKLLRLLNNLERAKIFKFEGNYWDFRLADQQFLEFVIDKRQNQTIAIITLDKKLSEDILLQNKICSFGGHPAKVFRVKRNGDLYLYRQGNKTISVEKYKKLFQIN